LKNLTLLNASENKLKILPFLPKNGKLSRIYLGENLITVLDVNSLIPSSNTLIELLLQSNKIESIGDSIVVLNKLKIFDVSNNNLSTLPSALGYMASLSKILVEGNPLRYTSYMFIFVFIQICIYINMFIYVYIYDIPSALGYMANLSKILVEWNPIR
jgi:Leucine-rich repeat (LRR) protein